MTDTYFEVAKNTNSTVNYQNFLLMPTNILESQEKYFDRENQQVKVLQLSIRTRFI